MTEMKNPKPHDETRKIFIFESNDYSNVTALTTN